MFCKGKDCYCYWSSRFNLTWQPCQALLPLQTETTHWLKSSSFHSRLCHKVCLENSSQRSLGINQLYNFVISQIFNFQPCSSLSAKVFKLELERRLNVMAHSSQRRLRMPSLKIKSNLQFKMWGFLNFPLSCPSLLKYENSQIHGYFLTAPFIYLLCTHWRKPRFN